MRVGEGFNFWDRALREQDLLPSTVKLLPTLSFLGMCSSHSKWSRMYSIVTSTPCC